MDVVERSGLTGRGGAGFPTGRKLRSVAAQRGRPVVVANCSEGEPASAKDRLLLSRSPHLVLDGISLAAYAVGADRAFVVLHRHEGRIAKRLAAAAAAREAAGIDMVPVEIVGIPGRYVSSEQSAIVQFLNGGPALPTFAPPRTHERGFDGRPTLVNNAETLAHLALIARHGDQWFRSAGVPDAAGTMLVTVGGAVARPGVYEIEMGTPIGAVLMTAGGVTERPQAILTGGYFGTWLPIDVAWQLPLTHRDLKAAGGALGAGIIMALPDTSCGLAETARVVRYLAGETAGQCGPCIFGLPALADAVADLAYQGEFRAVRQIEALVGLVAGRGACKHPDGATQLVVSALAAFEADVAWHQHRGPCFGVRRPPILPVPGDMADW
jgi:NADH:ubiquinone oxidoreductase subunit F (NADH-binding)